MSCLSIDDMLGRGLGDRVPATIRVVGWSNTGKTTLIERLIPLLRDRGLRIGTVKHTHHRIDFDQRGKDSWRHLTAGADQVDVVADQDVHAHELDRAVARCGNNVDLVLVEGFKQADGPKIMVGSDTPFRVEVLENTCRVSVDPSELSSEETARLVGFCLRHQHNVAA